MTSASDDAGVTRRETLSGRLVLGALAVIGIAILAVTGWSLAQTSALQHETTEIVDNMLTSVRLLGEVQTAIYRRQLLINRHIVASSPEEMHAVDVQLGALDQKVSDAMRTYEPWVSLPGERETWDRTRAHLSTLDEPVARALAFSRRNEDKEARDAMDGVENRFDEIDRDFDQLIAINNRAAYASLSRYGELQRRLMLTLVSAGVASLSLTLFAASRAWRRGARRREESTVGPDTLET
jgi:hypothetical protein